MKKLTKVLAVFLTLLLVIQSVPMNVSALESITEALNVGSGDVETTAAEETTQTDEATQTADNVQAEDSAAENSSAPSQSTEETEILYEITDDRTANTKSFMQSDGTRLIAQYENAVHYENADGEFVEYDNSLSEADGEDNEKEYKTKSSDIDIRISKKTNGKKLVRVTKDNTTLSWNFTGITKVTGEVTQASADDDKTTLENMTSEVVFSDVFTDTDLQYIIYGDSLKENIILNSKDAPDEFTAEYKYSGLTPTLSDDKKTIYLNNSENETVFVINAPYMQDANGEQNTNIYYELGEIKNNQFSVTLITDKAWLNAENRAYPVTVDPVILTSRAWSENNCSSAYVSETYADNCYGKNSSTGNFEGSLYVGCLNGRGRVRSYIKFDLPELRTGDKVVNAKMFTYLVESSDISVELHKVTKEWAESTITWNKAIPYDSSVVEYKSIAPGTYNAYIPWDITEAVHSWYMGSANYGLLMYSDSENASSQTVARFFSSGYTTTESKRPYLLVEVRNMSGYEDYYSFTSLSAGRGGSVSVNNYNGNVVSSHPVTLDIGGLRMPVNISAVYNSDKENMSICDLGKGWQLNYNLLIRPNPYLNDESSDYEKRFRYYYLDGDGTEHYFYFESDTDTEGVDEDGLGYKLTLNSASAPTVYTLTDKSGNFMNFNSLGNMTSITDKTGNCIYLVYESAGTGVRVKTIKDGGGRIYTLGYTSDTSTTLSTITDPASRVTTFNVSDGVLQSVTYPDGNAVTFSYTTINSKKYLNKVSNYDGMYVDIAYKSGTATVMAGSITEKSGSSSNDTYSFDYNQNETVVTDRQNRKFTYQFNYFGQPTGIVSDADKTALGFSYAPGNTTDANANKLLSSSRVQQSVQNYVTDADFRRGNLLSYYPYQPNADGDYTEMLWDDSYGHYADGSFKISRTTANGSWTDIDQHIPNLPAGTYTASAFISTNGNTVTNSKGIFAVQIVTDGAVSATYRCEPVTYTAAGEWVRRSITVTIDSNQYIKVLAGITDNATVGTYWVDDIQLEHGSGTNGFNVVSNSSFFKETVTWEVTADSNTVADSTLDGFINQLTLTPKSDGSCRIRQYLSFNGKTGDVLSAGAWIKADSVPTELAKNLVTPEKKANCKLQIEIISSGSTKKTVEKEYNPNVSSWQFVSTEIIADCNFDALRISIVYDNNCNSISVTGTYILAEEYGQSYTYDKNGNLISSADVSGSVGSYGFSAGNLNAVTNPTGSSVILANSEADNLLYHAQTTDGQRYDYTYDSAGNVTDLKVGVSKPVTYVTEGENYYIINVGSGKALSVTSTTTGTDCILSEWKTTDADNRMQQWTAVKSTSTTYSFRLTAKNTVSLDVSNGGSVDGTAIQVATNNLSNAQRFTPEVQSDGSFLLKTYCSSNTLTIDCDTNSGGEKKNGTAVQQKSADTVDSYNKWYLIPVNEDLTTGLYLHATASYTGTKNFKISETSADGITTNYNSNQDNGFLYSTTTDGIVTGYAQQEKTGRVWRVMKDSMAVFYSYSNENLSKISTPTTDYTFTYDAFSRNTYIRAGEDVLVCNYYNEDGLLFTQRYLNNTDMSAYYYDNLDRIYESYRNGHKLTYYYGSNGEVSYITDSKTGKRTQYEYDLADRIVSVKEFNDEEPYLFDLNSSLSYTYKDGTNQISSITAKTDLGENELEIYYGSIINGSMPDAVNMEWRNGKSSKTYFYDTLGRLQKTRTNADFGLIDVSYTYKAISENRTTSQVSALETKVGTFSYEYDNRGNIVSISDGTYTTTYTYDNLDQLTRENNEKLGKTYVYTYTNGNISSRTEYAYTISETLGTAVKTDTWTYGETTWGDVLTAYNGTSTAVNNGRITALGGKSLTYSYLGLLATAGTTSYSYDTSGRRLSKTTGSTTTNYYYAGDMLVGEKTGSNKIEFLYDSNGDYYGFEYNDTAYYYIKNLQGDVVAIYNNTGSKVATYEYDAWGRLISSTDTSGINIGTINPIRYRSYYYDTETGFYYLKTRYYSSEICRFLSSDTEEVLFASTYSVSDKNLFAYCDNNPVLRQDSGGQFWHIVAGAVIGGLFELGSQLFAEEELNWAKVGVATLSGGITAAAGPLAGAAISGLTNMALDALSGEKDAKKLIVSGVVGAGTSLIGSGVGKVVEKVGGKVATKLLGNMSKSKLKTVVTMLEPKIKGIERNAIKDISYLTSKYPNIGTQYFKSTRFGSAFTTSIEQISEGFAGGGMNHLIRKCFPSW